MMRYYMPKIDEMNRLLNDHSYVVSNPPVYNTYPRNNAKVKA